jgi:hypothetical protein
MEVKVAVCIPAREQVHTWFAQSLALAMGYMGKNQPEVDMRMYVNNGTILSEQRQALAKLALMDGADWTVWFDSDMRFPKDTIERLLAHAKPIVAANYPSRKMPAIEPTTFLDDSSQTRVYTEKDSTGLQAVGAVGFGCIAVHRSVFEAMPTPWFHIPWNEEDQKYECGEDIYFCRKARSLGFEVLVDHDLSKSVFHIGQFEWGHIEALQFRPKIEQLRPMLVNSRINTQVSAA